MSRYYRGWAPYVPVAKRQRNAEREMARLRKSGHPVDPVTVAGSKIATTFWGKAWCDNIESYRDDANRLPRGRTYVRNGSVVDLQLAPGRITAIVSGSELYRIAITIKETAQPLWRMICADCAGGIDSLVELLQGHFSKGVMERLCRQQGGLFPRPSEIRFSCSCPDGASMCKHVAATLYGVGTRLDQRPELLFRLCGVDENELITGIDAALPLSGTGPAAGKVLQTDDVSALFGLDMAELGTPAAKPAALAKPPVRSKAKPAPIVPPKQPVSTEASKPQVRPPGRRAAAKDKTASVRPPRPQLQPRPVKWWR